MNIDPRQMRSKNCWLTSAGELAVRPGLRKLSNTFFNNFAPSQFAYRISHAWSIPDPVNNTVWHYIVGHSNTLPRNPTIWVLDENWLVVAIYDLQVNVVPRAVTHAIIGDQIVIASPDFDTVWGLIGNGLVAAQKVESDNPTTTAVDVPRGLCVAWASRLVIAAGQTLWVSDPVTLSGGSPLTFTPQAASLFAPIFGLHVGDGEQLIVCTSEGVFGAPAEAAASGQIALIGSGGRSLLSHHRTLDYETTAVVQGTTYGLTRRGYQIIDRRGASELSLNDPVQPRAYGPRIARNDWREARIISGQEGLWIDSGIGATLAVDLVRGFSSWWTWTDTDEATKNSVRGTLQRRMGEEMLAGAYGVYRYVGGHDGYQRSTSENATAVRGTLYGVPPAPPQTSLTWRHVTTGNDGAGNHFAAVRAVTSEQPPVGTQRGLVIGTNSWGDTPQWEPPTLRSRRHDFSIATDDPGLEVGAERPETRFSASLELVERGIRRASEGDR